MPSLSRKESSSKSSHKSSSSSKTSSTRESHHRRSSSHSRSRKSKDSQHSHQSNSTAPTSVYSSSSRPSTATSKRSRSRSGATTTGTSGAGAGAPPTKPFYLYSQQPVDISPGTAYYPRASIDTYASTTPSEEEAAALEREYASGSTFYEFTDQIPPMPVYRREMSEPNMRIATPSEFGRLFPSLRRFSIRHDELTADGNMNLRIDTVVTGRRRTAIQLFHLRMYDLARREFSLRRYCRDSGREVCNSKREFIEAAPSKSKLKSKKSKDKSHSSSSKDKEREKKSKSSKSGKSKVASALKSLGGGSSSNKPGFRRMHSGGSATTTSSSGRPSTGYSTSTSYDSSTTYDERMPGYTSYTSFDSTGHPINVALKPRSSTKNLPTNTLKIEFSNYARVDMTRRGSSKSHKRYEFLWWGHRYQWKRAIEKHLGLVSFHLVKDGKDRAPVAHIVPETRSPAQVAADEAAGGWVPPCHMWIEDEKIVGAITDVADVIMATGLMALVDDCIKERWQTKKIHRIPVPLTGRCVDVEYSGARAFMANMFGRLGSHDHYQHHSNNSHQWQYQQMNNPLRYATNPVSAY